MEKVRYKVNLCVCAVENKKEKGKKRKKKKQTLRVILA